MPRKLIIMKPSKVTPEKAARGTYFHPDKINGVGLAKLLMSLPPSVLKKLCEDIGD
ncbi:hypothetical protein [Tunturiibacter gelidoferens]|uniref:Uncharacterized protein n=1 Tax=Tunturiibacter gelidiferens TaxID=3069689 RepID=A0A9X0QFE0_9BACT|nr:hypothetical protein [Edaphobacter lichenicola]MBB5329446.1 hypothetical protein [Edaphobacter lichenicola]